MLAERKLPDTAKLAYPLYASPKLDGIRALVIDGKLRSRALKPIPNRSTASRFSKAALTGLDGELILGDPTAPDVYRTTQKAVSTEDGEPDVKFYCFDLWPSPLPYDGRLAALSDRCRQLRHVELVPSFLVREEMELLHYEQECLDKGFEGLILRSPGGPYKFGRATTKEGFMLKLKRFVDSEAKVVGYYEEMHNTNEAKTNELGRTHRSSHQEGLVGKGRLGGLVLEDAKLFPGVQFECGTGFDAAERESLWKQRRHIVGRVAKYKYFAHGVKDKPRHPVFLGWRDAWDR